jgi:hypothetical protein
MTRRRVLCGLLLASAVLACGVGWLVIATARKVSRERFEQVRKGMSREQVIRTIGGQPGDYSSSRPSPQEIRCFDLHPTWHGKAYEQWLCDDGHLLVLFDDADMVDHTVVYEFDPPQLTERIRRWLGL